jgi:hypothetical protein
VLLHAESASKARVRLKRAIWAFYGLKEGDFINPYSQTTVKSFVDDFVTSRSRILHGTWSTLSESLEAGREGLQNFTVDLLKNYILAIEAYVAAGSPLDRHSAFLAFVERERQARGAKQ